ncbi:NAD(P)H-dependent oxidoreductase subunit E [Oceanomicrobium pacificus]|uniref:NADH-quinone oxidoreductase subunit F n=1 Tax=Oceanomicrobium pacificus TaxID=2692916 RepID=A0A6B0TXQ1_9RHOB|nr:NAD(P)H-dependent oxidoreductase subunit E [Oceanomicrobium pacificus]MXU65904.1 NADH-quinone oxidoreductase subunit F [Oceanomicrobium pacificus]
MNKAGVWKSGRGRGRAHPKGRPLEDSALTEVRALLGDRPRRRDLLIEHLHLIQDRFGHLSAAHLRALAEEMRLSQAEVQEVASFYAHFDIVKEGETPPPPVTVRVCDSLSCALAGSAALHDALEAGTDPSQIRIARAPCMGRCAEAPAVEVGHRHVAPATAERVQKVIAAGDLSPQMPDYEDLAAYRARGGYARLAAMRAGELKADDLAADVEDAGLRGLGGAGFPAARKWQFVRDAQGPRYLAVNGDEGEPGTFKDRVMLEATPHAFLEGTLLAAEAIGADRVYIYMRDEYPAILKLLAAEIAALERAGLVSPGFIDLRRGAGAYICGEESAMIESIEGKRGLPRHRPPYVAEKGIFDRPTLVHNVETLYWIARIAQEGPEVLNAFGRNGRTGLRAFSVSGRVADPGVKLAPAGITMAELLDEYCGGMAEGHRFKAYQPGGPSAGLLPATMADVPLDFDTLQPHGTFIGSAAIVVLSDQDSAADAARNMLAFFESESCGQCTPCRVGCAKAVQLMDAPAWDAEKLEELAQAMADASICGLGQAAPNPIRLALKHFPEETR